MKIFLRSVIILAMCCAFSMSASAQASGMIGISGGYGQTAYNMKDYDPVGYMPLSIRAAVGAYGIQFGPEFWTTPMGPTFNFTDSATGTGLYTVKIHDNYLGGMIRAHAGDDSRDFAIVFRAGMGVFFSKKYIDYSDYYINLYPMLSDGTVKFKNSIGIHEALS